MKATQYLGLSFLSRKHKDKKECEHCHSLTNCQRVKGCWHLNMKMCSFGNKDFQRGQTILFEKEYVKQDQQREAAETYFLLHVL